MKESIAKRARSITFTGLVILGVACTSARASESQPPSGGAADSNLGDSEPLSGPQQMQIGGRPPLADLLEIEQLERLAEEYNPTLRQAARRVEAARGHQLQVGLYPNPVIGYQAEEIGEGGGAGQHGMFFRQEMVTSNKLGLNRAVASHELRQAQWDHAIQRRRVINALRIRAYEVISIQRTMKIADDLVRIGGLAMQSAEKLYEAREVSQVDVLRARVEANTARLQLAAARKTYAAAWRRLAVVVGLPDMQPGELHDTLDENLPDLSWEETVAQLVAASPQVAHARSGVERAKCALARACAGRVPNVQTGASVRYNDDSSYSTVSLQVGVPLMIYDRKQGAITKARAELAAARQEVERIRLLLHDRMAEVFREYEIAREQVQEYGREILPDAKQSLELTRAGYEQGEFTYLELLTAQQTFSRTNLTYIDRLFGLWASAVQIDGMLLTGGLSAPGR